MKTTNAIAIAIAAACLCAAPASAMSLDPAVYEAYAAGPSGVIGISSKRLCSIGPYAKAGWKRARYLRGEGDIGVDACWKPNRGQFRGAVDVCLIFPDTPTEFSGCAPTAETDFVLSKEMPLSAIKPFLKR